MIGEIKYCKFCNKEKPIEEFVKSGFAIKNICRECQNKKQTQIYKDSKKVKELEKENQELKKQLEVGKEQYNDLVKLHEEHIKAEMKLENELEEQRKEYQEIYKDVRVEIKEYKSQQKEFIEYLENEIKNSDICDVYVHGMKFNSAEKMIYKDILSKYKEIVGGSNGE